MLMPMPMPICMLQTQDINPLSILFANAETFGAIPMPEAIPIPVPDAVADADANL